MIKPGLHRPLKGTHRVLWWDPAALKLNVAPNQGLRDEEVLVEGRREKWQQWIGRTTQNRVLNFGDPAGLAGDVDLRGGYCRVRVTASGPNSLVGEMLSRDSAAFNGFRILQ